MHRFLGKSSKLFIVLTSLQWKVWNFFPEISAKIFFWKLAYLVSIYIQKTSLTTKVCPTQNSVYQASHWYTLLIGCVNYLRRLYISILTCKLPPKIYRWCGRNWGKPTNFSVESIFYVPDTNWVNFEKYPIKWSFVSNSQTLMKIIYPYF